MELHKIDKQIWHEELDDFVPDRIFDIHTHIFSLPLTNDISDKIFNGLTQCTWDYLTQLDSLLFPDRTVNRLCFGFPIEKCHFDKANKFTSKQVAADKNSAALMLVHPSMTSDHIENAIREDGYMGFKPYRLFSVTGDVNECRITDFLPEHQLEVANRFGLMCMLHLSRYKAIGDDKNLDDLERLTQKYPNIKWVLAHCARSYFDGPLVKAARRLENIPNLWFEISSVCDVSAMAVLIEIAGTKRVMYGSDEPIGTQRGKYITFGYGWAEMRPDNHQFNLSHCNPEMTFVRYESLRAFKSACHHKNCDKTAIEDMFYNNAIDLLRSVKPENK